MTAAPTCPRDRGPLRPPDLWSSEWMCERHGAVAPFYVAPRACVETVEHAASLAGVPLWVPQPLLAGWTVTGVGWAGDERTGARATVLAMSGPSPLGGAADMVLVAEEPGIGLGAYFAGIDGPDAGTSADAAPDAKIEAAGHPTPLWATPSAEDRRAFAGEAMGLWLWAVLWPPAAELLLLENVQLYDVRERMPDVVFGAPSPYLTAAG